MTVEAGAKIVEGEKCALDMSSYEDLHSSPTNVSVGGGCGGECNGDGKDDYVIVNDSDAASDDHVENNSDREVNVAEFNVDGGIGDVESDRIDDNEVKVDDGELKVESNGVNVQGESEGRVEGEGSVNEVKVNGGELKVESHGINVEGQRQGGVEGEGLVKENGGIESESEVVEFEDGELNADNGCRSNNLEGEIDVKVSNSEVVEGSDAKPVMNEMKDEEFGVENGDNGNVSVDGTDSPSLDDDDKVRVMADVDSAPPQMEAQNGTVIVEAEHQVPDGEHEEQQEVVQPQEDESQGNEPERIHVEVREAEVVEDNGEGHKDEGLIKEPESIDSVAIKSEPLVAEVRHRSLDDGLGQAQPSDGDVEVPHSPQSSESQPIDAEEERLLLEEDERSLPEDLIHEKQSLSCQQLDLQPTGGDNKELHSDEAEADVRGQGDLDPPVAGGSQVLYSVDSEAASCEVEQSNNGESTDQITSDSAAESQETQVLQPTGGDNKELHSDEAEAEVRGQADLDSPVAGGSQVLHSLDSEAATCEVDQSNNGELTDQITSDSVAESQETQVLQTLPNQSQEAENQGDLESESPALLNQSEATENQGLVESESLGLPNQSEEAENQGYLESESLGIEGPVSISTDQSDICKLELTSEVEESNGASVVNMQSDTTDEPAADRELERVDGEGKPQMMSEVGESQETSAGEDTILDQVAEETGSVDAIDKVIPPEDISLEKRETIEDATSKLQFADGAIVEEDGNDLGHAHVGDGVLGNEVVDDLVNDSQTVPVPGESFEVVGSSSGPEDCSLSAPVDGVTDLPALSDSDTIKERGVFGDSSCVADDSLSCSADDSNSQPKLESNNGPLPYSVLDNNSEIGTVNDEVDVGSESNYVPDDTFKSKISFGSFECASPFSQNGMNLQTNVPNNITEFSTGRSNVDVESSKSKVDPANGVALLNSQLNGVHITDSNHEKRFAQVVHSEQNNRDESSTSPPEGSGADSSDGQIVNPDLVRKPFYYLIRIPRFDDQKLSEQIRQSELQVEEKTRIRDAVGVEYHKKKALCRELKFILDAAKKEERAARDLMTAKRREIESAQSLINLARNAITVEDVDSQILSLEHRIQHETLPLSEEKKLIREIKQLNQQREQLSANSRRQRELQQALDQRVQTEENLKILRKEMDALRDNHSKEDERVKAATKKFEDESALLNNLLAQFDSADNIRQAAYAHLSTLKKQWFEKNKHFWNCKDDFRIANDYAAAGKTDSLERYCVNQVEKIIEMWNKNDEFRKEYIRCNTRSTIRRLGTVDGRGRGPDDAPPSLGNVYDDRVNTTAKVNTVATAAVVERDFPIAAKSMEDKPSKKVTEQKNKTAVTEKIGEAASKNNLAEGSGATEIEEKKEECKLTKEEEELAKKAEQLRREEEAARLREQRRLEEKIKAQEALERKKRNAEKAQARAKFRARKEAEEKEKEREKRAKKKEKKKGLISETTEIEPSQPTESSSETVKEPEVTEKPVTVGKKPQKAPLKQIKTIKSAPASIRNKGKRKFPNWWWAVIFGLLAVVAFLYFGNSDILQKIKLKITRPAH